MLSFQGYLNCIAKANGLVGPTASTGDPGQAGNLQWMFYPGMLQDSPDKWWADFGQRHTCHEGIDICFYRKNGIPGRLPPGARVPAMAAGTLLNIPQDLLGHTLVVSLDIPESRDTRTVMVYSHTVPAPGLTPGTPLETGQIIARTFDTRIKGARLLSHLHLSCIILPRDLPDQALDWTLFADRSKGVHLNPVFL